MSETPPPPAWSLRKRLARGLVLTAMLPMVLFAAILLVSEWQRNRDELMRRLDANATLNAAVVDDFLDSQLAGVRLLANQMSDDPARRGEELGRLLDIYPSMLRVHLVDARGDVVAVRDARGRALPPLPGLVAGEAWFQSMRNGSGAAVSGVYRRSAYGTEEVVGVAAPLLRDGRFAGALQAEIPVQTFTRLTAESLGRRGLAMLLLDADNRVVHAGPELRWIPLAEAGADGLALQRNAITPGRGARILRMDGLLRDGGTAYVEAVAMRNGWTLVLVASRSHLLVPCCRACCCLRRCWR